MTKLHKTLEKLYFLLESIDPDNLTDKKVGKIRKEILKCQGFTKENIDFYSFDRFEAAKIVKQSKIISRKAREVKGTLYRLDLNKSNRSSVDSYFDIIQRIVVNIELSLTGPNHIYTVQYIATAMAIENDFIYQPIDKTIKGMAEQYATIYYDRYGITIKADSLRKEYIGQFDKDKRFTGAKKDIDKKIIKTYLSKRNFRKLHDYLYDNG